MKTINEENMERCLNFMRDRKPKKNYYQIVLGIKTEKELMFKLSIIPEMSRKVIIAKWGLEDGEKIAVSFKLLNKKFEVTNSRVLYAKALNELSEARYLVFCDKLGNWSCIFKNLTDEFDFYKAVSYARFRMLIIGSVSHFDGTLEQYSKAVDNMMKTRLIKKERNALIFRFGFFNGIPKNMEYVEKRFNVTKEEMRNILRKIRNSYYSVVEN